MEENKHTMRSDSGQEKAIALLENARSGREITVRDDQCEYAWLLDAAHLLKPMKTRFRLVDSGYLNPDQMEWLAKAGADIYTGDTSGRSAHDVEFINEACRGGGSFTAFFQHGPISLEESSESPVFADLLNLGGNGVYLHVSNKETERDFSLLNELAHACSQGGGWLICYFHGPLDGALVGLAESGAWVHLSARALASAADSLLLLDILKGAKRAGTGVVLYADSQSDISLLEDVLRSGGHLIFAERYFDYRSPFRALCDEARRHPPDIRACYLNTILLP